MVHDGWKPQLNTPAKHHQTCLPHLLRRLNYLNKKYPNTTWGKKIILLYDATQLNKKIEPQPSERSRIIAQLDQILDQPPDKNYKLYSFYKRMCRERQHLFYFFVFR